MFEKGNSEKIMVSIIIPVYNIEKYVEKCLNSLKRQTYNNFEAIIVDDGSTDSTGSICERISRNDERFKIFHKKNEGVSVARNFGLSKAKGLYIGFVDGDDYLDEDYLKILVGCMKRDNIDLVCVDYFLDLQGEIIIHSSDEESSNNLSREEAINKLSDRNCFQGYLWNKLFKKEIIEKNKLLFDKRVKIWEDMLFCLRYLTYCYGIVYIQKPLYYYVQRENSAMANSSVWRENTHLCALEQMWDIAKNFEGEFKEYIRNFYANDLVGQLFKCENESHEDVKKKIKMIEYLKGELTLKHKIKKMTVKILPWKLARFLYKN